MKKQVQTLFSLLPVILLSSCVVTMNEDNRPLAMNTSYNGYTVGYGYGNVDNDQGYGSFNTIRGFGGWASSYYSPGQGYMNNGPTVYPAPITKIKKPRIAKQIYHQKPS